MAWEEARTREYLALVDQTTGTTTGAKPGTNSKGQDAARGQVHHEDSHSHTDKDKDKDRDKTPQELEMMALWEVKVDVELRRRAIQYQLKQFRRIMDGNMTSMFKIGMMHQLKNGETLEEDERMSMALEDAMARKIQRAAYIKFGRVMRAALRALWQRTSMKLQRWWYRMVAVIQTTLRARRLRLALLVQGNLGIHPLVTLSTGTILSLYPLSTRSSTHPLSAGLWAKRKAYGGSTDGVTSLIRRKNVIVIQRVARGFLGRLRLKRKRVFNNSIEQGFKAVSPTVIHSINPHNQMHPINLPYHPLSTHPLLQHTHYYNTPSHTLHQVLTATELLETAAYINGLIENVSTACSTGLLSVLRGILFLLNGDKEEVINLYTYGIYEPKYLFGTSLSWKEAYLFLLRKGRFLRRVRGLARHIKEPNPFRLVLSESCVAHLKDIDDKMTESDFDDIPDLKVV